MRRFFMMSLTSFSLTAVPCTIYLVLTFSRLRHWFAQPWALTLAALVPGVWAVLMWNAERRRRALARLGSFLAIESLLTVRRGLGVLRAAALLFGLLALSVGVAGPQWGRDFEQTAAPGRDLVVVLDCSRSMFAEQPSRFQRARDAALDLCREVQKRGGHRLGLVVFAGRAELACPLTHDYDHFRATLEDLDPDAFPADLGPGEDGKSGTCIGAALKLAVEAHDERFREARDILLLSDGDDPADETDWPEGVAAARAQHIPVYVVGVGNPKEASTIPLKEGVLKYRGKEVRTSLNERLLKLIAKETEVTEETKDEMKESNKNYIPAHTSRLPLGTKYLEMVANKPLREASVDALPLYRQRYPYFLLPALALLALAVAVPDRLPKLPRLRWRLLPAAVSTDTGNKTGVRTGPRMPSSEGVTTP
jgi:Ca-activated chloride channel family protein